MNLPAFRYHPDPLASGSVIEAKTVCKCCHQARGYVYTGPAYSEEELGDALCPWCIADGSAHANFDVTFVDSEAFTDTIAETIQADVVERTPGYNAWQGERWPVCCGDATAFIQPAGSKELRDRFREQESALQSHISHGMKISGDAASRLMASLDRVAGPTVFLFRCLRCERVHFHLDQP